MQPANVVVAAAESPQDWRDVRTLFRHYAQWLNVDLCFQDFEQELAALPGCYAAPRGRVLLGRFHSQAVGCVGLRPLADNTCEMKRLWVEPEYQGLGLGRRLAKAIVAAGHELGYRAMRLDTLPERLVVAQHLYHALGFREIAPYYANPLEGVAMYELCYGDQHSG